MYLNRIMYNQPEFYLLEYFLCIVYIALVYTLGVVVLGYHGKLSYSYQTLIFYLLGLSLIACLAVLLYNVYVS